MPTFTTVVDKAIGDTWTASMWNTYLRDNVNGLLSKPACRIRRTTTLALTANTDTQVTFDTEDVDTDGMHSTSVNTQRITITTAGLYLLVAQAGFTTSTVGFHHQVTIYKNGTTDVVARQRQQSTTPGSGYVLCAQLAPLAAADYVQAYALATSTGFQVPVGATFAAIWLGRTS